ncbi:Rieske (2Fe-2S) protein [Kribbella jiaozuonensis]|uniref:Rieske 2Fe-2S domain-containing protein n=1 Tax=Kribbella jiaozuonensis TaxID=2575441 RepID=A0A4U3LVN7_9ACTN|nr:Rieske 2Fe-2S domain-containing protein [Kribbella jiaozuonensis]TKK80181.1 Rieske 2Fe-2S domain-containing protein [Kribbella jiaozuonensis]
MTELSILGVVQMDAIADGMVVPHYVADRKLRIALARVDGKVYAFDDLCTCSDERCPLSSGLLVGRTIMCQCHGSRFALGTGAVLQGSAAPLRVYEVREADGTLQVRLPEGGQ